MSEAMEKERFVIDSDQRAEWAIGKIQEAKKNIDFWVTFYTDKIAAVKRDNLATIANMEALLEEYFQNVPHHKTKTQESYSLPSGKLVRKAQQPEYKKDADVLAAWLKENASEYIKQTVTESVDWAGLKSALTALPDGSMALADTGEVVEGVKAVHRDPVFEVKING